MFLIWLKRLKMMVKRSNVNPIWMARKTGGPVRVFQPRPRSYHFPNAEIMSVQLSQDYTRIDFRFTYEVSEIKIPVYTIDTNIYIAISSFYDDETSIKKHNLIKQENAPVYPRKYVSDSNEHPLYFTLYFEPLPMHTVNFDVVEKEKDEDRFDHGVFMNYPKVDLRKGVRNWKIENSEN